MEKIKGIFLERINRFACKVDTDGKEQEAFLPDSKRLSRIIERNDEVILATTRGKFPYKIIATKLDNLWIFLDNLIVGNFLEEEIEKGNLPVFKNWKIESKKEKINSYKVDLILKKKNKKMLCKINYCLSAINGISTFPDTLNLGRIKDIKELTKKKREGKSSAIIFVAPREDVKDFAPNSTISLSYSKNLYKAILEGVEIYLVVIGLDPSNFSLKINLCKKLDILEILRNEYHIWRYPEVFIKNFEKIKREIFIEMVGTTCYHCSFEENFYDFLDFARERGLYFKVKEITSKPGKLYATLRLNFY
ncbi:MAG: DNA/RNA nuclease SfsA [Candidatus Hydrothermales bacterium]